MIVNHNHLYKGMFEVFIVMQRGIAKFLLRISIKCPLPIGYYVISRLSNSPSHLSRCLVLAKVWISFSVVVCWYGICIGWNVYFFYFVLFFLYHFDSQKIDELWLCDNESFQIKKQQSCFVKDNQNHEFSSV